MNAVGDLKHHEGVVQSVNYGPDFTSSSGNDYVRVVFQSGLQVDFYNDDWREELRENQEEYEGLITEVFYEDRGYTVGKAIVPSSSKKAGELLEKKISDDFEGLSEKEKEEVIDQVEKIFEHEKGNQEGLDSYAA